MVTATLHNSCAYTFFSSLLQQCNVFKPNSSPYFDLRISNTEPSQSECVAIWTVTPDKMNLPVYV